MKTKISLLLLCSLIASGICLAQGFIGNSPNTLYPVNNLLQLNPIKLGIGTNLPTEQFHTTQGVRFEGLQNDNDQKRVLVQDLSGKLYWREASTIAPPLSDKFWSLGGNSSTIPGTGPLQNYLGTTDAQRLVFATNATEKMTILTNGNIGIGNSAPPSLLTVGNGVMGGPTQTYTLQVLGQQANAVEHLAMLNNNQSNSRSELTISNSGTGNNWSNNFLGLMVHGTNFPTNNYLNQSNKGLALLNAQGANLTKLSVGVFDNKPLSFYTNNTERLFINGAGFIGVGTTAP